MKRLSALLFLVLCPSLALAQGPIDAAAPTITIVGAQSFVYDAVPHPTAATVTGLNGVAVSGSLTISYSPGGAAAPLAAGYYIVTASFISADPNYTDATATASILIANPTVSVRVPFEIVHGFVPAEASQPEAPLVQTADGNFYSTTFAGGAFRNGTVFRMAPDGSVTILHSFGGADDGAAPWGGLLQSADGSFYGTTEGTVFRMSPDGQLTTLHRFAFAEGRALSTSLVQGRDGNFYGVAPVGGIAGSGIFSQGFGTIFKIAPDGTFTLLHTFTGPDGAIPQASLIQASDGNFYGTTGLGGTTELYGTTGVSGAANYGTIFRMTPDGALTVLYSFMGSADGGNPSGLVQARDGNIYGTTWRGTVFKMALSGDITVLAAGFRGFGVSALIQAADGNLYGTTSLGQIFSLRTDGTPAGTMASVLYASAGESQGALLEATDGWLYGTADRIGGDPDGIVFRVPLANTPAGPNVSVTPLDVSTGTSAVTMTFDSVQIGGNTSVAASTSGPDVPAQFQLGNPPLFYDITTTVTYTGPITICVDYGSAAFDSSSLHLLHFDSGAWVDVTTTVDTTSHTVCGVTMSLSPFVVASLRDTKPPITTATASSLQNAAGWNNNDVVITLSATDSGPNASGVRSITYSVSGAQVTPSTTVIGSSVSITISTEGVSTISYSSTDSAGNAETQKTWTVRLDKTAPVIIVAASVPSFWPPDGKMVSETFSGTISDALSGVDPTSLTFHVIDKYGEVQPSGTVALNPDGTLSFNAMLEARRLGTDLAGRQYQIIVTGRDRAGNTASASTGVIVPHDKEP